MNLHELETHLLASMRAYETDLHHLILAKTAMAEAKSELEAAQNAVLLKYKNKVEELGKNEAVRNATISSMPQIAALKKEVDAREQTLVSKTLLCTMSENWLKTYRDVVKLMAPTTSAE